MFNTASHMIYDTTTKEWTKKEYRLDVRAYIKLSKGKYNGATAVYHKHVPLGLILKEFNLYHSLNLTSNPEFTAIGQYLLYKDGELLVAGEQDAN